MSALKNAWTVQERGVDQTLNLSYLMLIDIFVYIMFPKFG